MAIPTTRWRPIHANIITHFKAAGSVIKQYVGEWLAAAKKKFYDSMFVRRYQAEYQRHAWNAVLEKTRKQYPYEIVCQKRNVIDALITPEELNALTGAPAWSNRDYFDLMLTTIKTKLGDDEIEIMTNDMWMPEMSIFFRNEATFNAVKIMI